MERLKATQVRRILKMRECGSTYKEIAKHMSKERPMTRQAVHKTVKRYSKVMHSDKVDNKKVEE